MSQDPRSDPYTRITERLLARSDRRSGNDFICPAHDDHDPSLGVTLKDGKVLVHCATGCATEDVLAAIGMTLADLNGRAPDRTTTKARPLPKDSAVRQWATNLQKTVERRKYWTHDRLIDRDVLRRYEIGWNPHASASGGRQGAYVFPFRDASGKLLNVKARFPAAGDLGKTYRLVPGHETEMLWPQDQFTRPWVVLCEGESDVLRAITLGIPAVTSITGAGGAEKAAQAFAPSLQGLHVVVATDADEAGRKSAGVVAQIVARYAETVRIFDPFPKRSDGSDLSDWLAVPENNAELFKDLMPDIPLVEPATSIEAPSHAFLFPEGRFNPPRLGVAAEQEANLRKGPGKSLWRYEDGLYVPDGDEWLAGYVREVLMEEFREGRLREVRAWCKANFTRVIPTQPSTDYINVANGTAPGSVDS